MTMNKIYLSPSNQDNNSYCVGGTTEKAQMEAVAQRLKVILDSEYSCETIMADLSLGIGTSGRPLDAKNKGCGIYLAIHSNAGGGGTASGAVAFYHPSSAAGKSLASNLVAKLNAVCPVKSNRSSPVQNGMSLFDGQGLGEIRTPTQYGLTAVLIEVDFHDNPKTAQWIISSKDAIARACAEAIAQTFGISKKQTQPATPPAPSGKLYHVQVGAYAVKANADAMLAKIKAAGFDGFIRYE